MVSARLSRPWLCACPLLIFYVVREASGWCVQSGCSVRTRSPIRASHSCCSLHYGLSPRRQGTDHLSLPKSLTRSRTRWTVELAASSVISEGEESAETPQQKKKEKELKAEEDSDTPIFYIKGLKDGGGVGVWGDEDDGKSRPLEGGDAVSAAKAMKNAISRNTMGGAAEVEEGEEEKAADNNPVWERIQASLGLGTWSYVGLGVSLFLILLNNFLGLGWLARFLVPDFDPLVGEGQPSKSPSQNQEIETMPLGAPSNFLSL